MPSRNGPYVATWWQTDELTEMGMEAIRRWHPHLAEFPIRFVWRDVMRKVKLKKAAGTAEIVKGRFATFVMTDEEKEMEGQSDGPAMFWIEIAEEAWIELSDDQRWVLLDHELRHCILEESDGGGMKLALAPHDLEEFEDIARRHGVWHPGIGTFVEAVLDHDMERAMAQVD